MKKRLFRVSYQDRCDEFNKGTCLIRAYDWEQAEEKFYDSDDDGWEAISIKEVKEPKS